MSHLLNIAALIALLALNCRAAITVNGLASKSTYTGNVTFSVPAEPGFQITAMLNENVFTLDSAHTESEPGYHELTVTKTPNEGGPQEKLVVQFIVRDPDRPSSDKGISTWTPRPAVAAPGELLDEMTVSFVVPESVPPGMTFPFAIRLENGNGDFARLNARPLISDSSGNASVVKVLRGAGSGSWTAPDSGPLTLTLHLGHRTFDREIAINPLPSESLSGEIAESITFPASSIIDITSDTLVPAGLTLRFEEACLVRLAPGVTMEILGALEIAGTPEKPVVFSPLDTQPWGGIFLRGGSATAEIKGAFFTGGGAEDNWTSNNGFSAHRKEQPILTFDAGTTGGTCIANLTDTWIIDNPTAQAAHGRNANITFNRCLIQRTTTAGQYNGGTFNFFESHALEFPVDSQEFSDADNDGFYLTNGTHHIRGSVIGWSKDDGIDCGGSEEGTLLVEDSWIDSCFHEGFALSGDKLVTIDNTVTINNGQGLEVGYSGPLNRPDGTATNMLIVGNAHGARYGDNYDWDYKGKLNLFSSILLQNRADVFGFEWDSWTYREEEMTIENNVLTSPLSRHPTNAVLDPAIHAPQIAAFLEGETTVRGFAIITKTTQNPRTDYGGDIPLHLDRPASATVTIPWKLLSAKSVIASGSLEFPPGEVLQTLTLPPLMPPHNSSDWIAIQFENSPTATATGPASCHFLDLPGGSEPPETTLVDFGSNWRYLSDGSNQGTAWRAPGFDDTSWSSGAGQLGYGDDDEQTDVGYTGTTSSKNATTYFRHQFEVADPSIFSTISLDLLFDDGAVVYLNGDRIASANMPAGDPAFDFYIGSTSSDNERETFSIDSTRLVSGTNTLAVEIHQEGPTSSDISFDLEVTATQRPLEDIATTSATFHNEHLIFWTSGNVTPQTTNDLRIWRSRPDLSSPLTIGPGPSLLKQQFFRLLKTDGR